MSRKFVGKLIRIMMTKSSSCDILKKKRTIRRGSGSRPKGSYLMDLRFWNYVIPDGSTTGRLPNRTMGWFWNYVIPDGSTTRLTEISTRRCFGTMSFQMVLLHSAGQGNGIGSFGTMSFQMVLLPRAHQGRYTGGFGTMSFQMVLLPGGFLRPPAAGFGTMSFQMVLLQNLQLNAGMFRFGTMSFQMVLLRKCAG